MKQEPDQPPVFELESGIDTLGGVYICMGRCEIVGGYEIARIRFRDGRLIERWLDQAEELPHMLRHQLAQHYLGEGGKPDPDDIVGVSFAVEGKWHTATVTIRRGFRVVAAFLKKGHRKVVIETSKDRLFLQCRVCGSGINLVLDSLEKGGHSLASKALTSHYRAEACRDS